MRYALAAAVCILSWGWAQRLPDPRKTRVFVRDPDLEAIMKNVRWRILEEWANPPPSHPHLRTTGGFSDNLTWLKPHQDADTVPDVPTTRPDFAGDTLLANGAGTDLSSNVPPACNNAFFDSLYEKGAWLLFIQSPKSPGGSEDGVWITTLGNYLFPPRNTDWDTIYYLGGGVAERYDIEPPPGKSVYIKGIAALIFNNVDSFDRENPDTHERPCTPQQKEVRGGPWCEDGVYTIGYQLYDTIRIAYRVARDDVREGTYPANLIAEVTKGIEQVRIGYRASKGQCITRQTNILEAMDYAYFSEPVTGCNSFYVALRFDLYHPDLEELTDTLFTLIGPAYEKSPQRHPCLTADTISPGRNMLLYVAYSQSQSRFLEEEHRWYPQYFLFTGRGYDLNLLIFPIIYVTDAAPSNCEPLEVDRPTCLPPEEGSIAIRNGQQGISLPYPNPATDCLYLNLETPAAGTFSLNLYTPEGRLVQRWTRQVGAGQSTVSLDVAVPAGAYVLMVQGPYGGASFWVNILN